MTVLLKDALKPNLVQTLEGQPVLMHCGPFANIAHGNNSLIADLIAMKLGDYVLTESGFGSDMGMEKFFDIVCRFGGLTPAAAVLVVDRPRDQAPRRRRWTRPGAPAVTRSRPALANVRRHLETIATFGVPAVVAVNRRPGDTNEECELVRQLALEAGAFGVEINDGFSRGGEGATDLAQAVVDACEQPNNFRLHLRGRRADPGQDRGGRQERVRRQGRLPLSGGRGEDHPVHRAGTRRISPSAWRRPTCRSAPTRRCCNAPENFTLPVRDIRAYTGAGWLVPLCGDITQMPGLGKTPAAHNIDIDENGRTVGLF